MGKFALFNTGFEYKFRDRVQDWNDIQLFGGEVTRKSKYQTSHKWKKDDKDKPMFQPLITDIDFDEYEKTVEGTQTLYLDLINLELDPTYILGCLIYHQLLYNDILQSFNFSL